MIDERREELAALHAFGLLEGPEREAFELELATDPELCRRLDELTEAAACLAHLAPSAAPPPELRDRILAAATGRGRASDRPAEILGFPRVLIPWAIAACLAIAAGWIGQSYFTARSENAVLRDQRQLAELELRSVRNQMEAGQIISRRQLADLSAQVADARQQMAEANAKLAGPEQQSRLSQLRFSTLSAMPGQPPSSLAMAVWDPAAQKGMLEVAKLPLPPSGKDYQLWVIDPSYAKPVNAGVFRVDPVTCQACVSFRTRQPVRLAAKFAVSLERKGGAAEREGPIVLLGE